MNKKKNYSDEHMHHSSHLSYRAAKQKLPLSPGRLLTALSALASKGTDGSWTVIEGREPLADLCCFSVATLDRATKYLEEKGYIVKLNRYKEGSKEFLYNAYSISLKALGILHDHVKCYGKLMALTDIIAAMRVSDEAKKKKLDLVGKLIFGINLSEKAPARKGDVVAWLNKFNSTGKIEPEKAQLILGSGIDLSAVVVNQLKRVAGVK